MTIRGRASAFWRVLGLAAGLALAASTSPLAAQSPAQLLAQLTEQTALDDQCKVLDADQRRAIDLFADELRTTLSDADKAAIDGWLPGMRSNLAAIACTDPRVVAAAGQAKAIGTDRQMVWAARVQAVAALRGETLWASMGDVSGLKRTAADAVLADLAARNPAAAQQFRTVAKAEATRALSVLCPSMSINAGKCPALAPAATPPEVQFARAWLERVEQYASQMPGANADGKPVLPAGVANWDQLYAVIPLDLALGLFGMPMTCDATNHVVRLDGPVPTDMMATTPATIFRARDGIEQGRGEVSPIGMTLILKGKWVETLGSSSMGLARCQVAP